VKLSRIAFSILILPLLFSFSSVAQTSQNTASPELASVQPFLGRWDLTLFAPGHTYGSWLELTDEGGQLQGRMVSRWGHAHPILNVEVHGSTLTFSSPAKEEASRTDMPFEGKLIRGKLSGTLTAPDKTIWRWSGQPAPTLSDANPPVWGKPVTLFDGKDTKGWWFNKPQAADTWTGKDGLLTTHGSGSDIISKRKFRDFKLHVEFNCAARCNSGVYLRGRYEVQIADSSFGHAPPNRRTGAVYGYLAPTPEIPITPDTWHTYDITLIGRNVTVVQDGKTVIDNQEIPGPTGGALDSQEGQPGPIYLQGSERAGATSFRNLVIIPAKS
jgi:hypothetical protein